MSRVHREPLSSGAHRSLDVAEVFLEQSNCQRELAAKIIKTPLLSAEELDNLLPTGAFG
jgi:hypothetical protein